MANLFLNLAVPALDGVGAAVDTSALGQERTITVQGSFRATITIEIANDAGADFVALTSFSAPGKVTLPVAARFMRVRVSGARGGPVVANADVASSDIGGLYLNLPATAGDGTGVSINVSTFGTFNTVVVTGDFTGQVILQISEDGIDWADCMVFGAPGQQSKEFVAQFARVVRSGSKAGAAGSAEIDLGAITDATAGGGGGGGAPATSFVFQPGGAGVGPVVFSSWPALIAALAAARAAGGPAPGGVFEIEFDDTLATPAVIPAGGPYDMTDVGWVGRTDDFATAVDIADGASFTGLRRFARNISVTNRNTVTPADSSLANGDLVAVKENSTINSAPGAAPFYSGAALVGGDTVIVFLTEASSTNFSGTGPVFDFPVAGSALFVFLGITSTLDDASVAGGAGSVLITTSQAVQFITTTYPAWLGTILAPRLDGSPGLIPNPYLAAASAAPLAASFGRWLRLDASGGAIAQPLPPISAAPGGFSHPGEILIVSEEGGGTGLTLTPAGGDTISGGAAPLAVPANGAVILTSDGLSNWGLVSRTSSQVSSQCLVFREGAADTGPTVFGTWAALIARLAELRVANNGAGCYQILFDDSLLAGANMSVPTGGPYDMTDVEWIALRTGRPAGFPADVNVDIIEGATFTKLRRFRGNIHVRNAATATVPNTDIINGEDAFVADGAQLDNQAGLVPFYRASGLVATQDFTLFLSNLASLSTAGNRPLVDMPVTATTLRLEMQSSSTVAADVLSAVAGVTLAAVLSSGSASIDPTQTQFLGTYADLPGTRVRMFADQTITIGNIGMVPNQIARLDTTAQDRTATLPLATRRRGQLVGVVNELGANDVIITAAGGDTIKGAGTFVLGPGEAVLLATDGVATWLVMSRFDIAAGPVWNIRGPVTSLTLAAIDDVLQLDPTAGIFTVNLPAVSAANSGRVIKFKNVSASATAVTLSPAGADTIDAAATLVMAAAFAAVELISDGVSNWMVS